MTDAIDPRELVFTCHMPVPPQLVYRGWTDPALLVQWFTPAPWKTVKAEVDVRPGGSNYIEMESPEGQRVPNRGVYLDVVPNERLVITDAFTSAWEPSPKAFMTVVLTFVPEGTGTRYTARVQHWSESDREAHEEMGFHHGWGAAAEQLAALLAPLVPGVGPAGEDTAV
jgi:uncharacterized protein YndB with AHSA1/START domain